MTLADLGPDALTFAHELAEQQRRDTEAGYDTVRKAYGWAYANGWKSGRNRLADLIDPEVSES